MSYERLRNTEEHFNFRGFFLYKANVSSEEKIKVFGKSTVAIHSLILRSTEVDRSVYGQQWADRLNKTLAVSWCDKSVTFRI